MSIMIQCMSSNYSAWAQGGGNAVQCWKRVQPKHHSLAELDYPSQRNLWKWRCCVGISHLFLDSISASYASIAMDVHSMVSSLDVFEQVLVVENIHGRLVIQQYPVPWNDWRAFYSICKNEKPAVCLPDKN